VDPVLAATLPIHNLRLAAPHRVMAPCAECYARFGAAIRDVSGSTKISEGVSAALGEGDLPPMPVHPVEVFRDPAVLGMIAAGIKRDLSPIRAACYYGCLLVRPPGYGIGDDPEHPVSMDVIAAGCGATPVDWESKTECCGAALSLCEPKVAMDLSLRVINAARHAGANCVLTACQMCHTNLELCQKDAAQKMPVVYFTQVIGLALGFAPRELGFGSHLIDAGPVYKAVIADG